MKKIKQKFQEHKKLYSELWYICDEYVTKNNIRPGEFFRDFLYMGDDSKIALFFNDENDEPCQTYTSVTIDELEKFVNNFLVITNF